MTELNSLIDNKIPGVPIMRIRIPCLAHVVQLVVQCILRSVTQVEDVEDDQLVEGLNVLANELATWNNDQEHISLALTKV